MKFKVGTIVTVKRGCNQDMFVGSIYKVRIASRTLLGLNMCTIVKRGGPLGSSDYMFVDGMNLSFTDDQLSQVGMGFAEWARTKGR